jgi:hypothetical protein
VIPLSFAKEMLLVIVEGWSVRTYTEAGADPNNKESLATPLNPEVTDDVGKVIPGAMVLKPG